MMLSDHIQKVLKPNFAAAWEEVGDDHEKEETFALSSIKTLDGEKMGIGLFACTESGPWPISVSLYCLP